MIKEEQRTYQCVCTMLICSRSGLCNKYCSPDHEDEGLIEGRKQGREEGKKLTTNREKRKGERGCSGGQTDEDDRYVAVKGQQCSEDD